MKLSSRLNAGSSRNPGCFAQPLCFGEGRPQLVVVRFKPMGKFLHDRDRYVREFPHHAHEGLFRDAQRYEAVFGTDRRVSRGVAQNAHLADDLVGADRRQYHWSCGRFGNYLGMSLDDQVGCVGGVSLSHQELAGIEGDAFAHERQ